MSTLIYNALARGYNSKQIIDYIIKQFPSYASKFQKALSEGFTHDQILENLTEHEKTRQSELSKKAKRDKVIGTAALTGASLAVSPYLFRAANNVISNALPSSLRQIHGAIQNAQEYPNAQQGQQLPTVPQILNPQQNQQNLSQQPPVANVQNNLQTPKNQATTLTQQPQLNQATNNQINDKSQLTPQKAKTLLDKLINFDEPIYDKHFGKGFYRNKLLKMTEKEREDFLNQNADKFTQDDLKKFNDFYKNWNPEHTIENLQNALEAGQQESETQQEHEKVYMRGDPIKYEELPEKLYHVTTNKKGVLESGELKTGMKGGLGGAHKAISFTSDKETAKNLEKDMKDAARFFNLFPNDEGNGIKPYEYLKKMAEKEGFTYLNIYDHPDFKDKFESIISKTEPLSLLKEYYSQRDEKLNKEINPLFLRRINADPDNISILEIDKNQIKESDKDKIRTGDEWLKEVAVYGNVPIQKNSIVGTPQGVGEVREIRNGKAIVEIDGKLHKVDESEIEEPPLPRKELADLYEDLKNEIESQTGEEVSRHVTFLGYDPNLKQLIYMPWRGQPYTYNDVTDEEIANLKDKINRKTSGENFIGAYQEGTESPIGAAMSEFIQRRKAQQKEKGIEKKEPIHKAKFEKLYYAYEPAEKAAEARYKERKKQTKKNPRVP